MNQGVLMTSATELHRPSILVVDDEHLIADTLAQILNLRGYDAVPAYSGEAALQSALRTSPELLITDIVMPEMNGIELAMGLQHIAPQCKVILTSGHSLSTQLLDLAGREGRHFAFLHKPVHPAQLLIHVSEVIYRHNCTSHLAEA
jgi:CheY-like chemotaxis protein